MKKTNSNYFMTLLAVIFFLAVFSQDSLVQAEMIFNNLNNDPVYNNPTNNTEFSISTSYYITYIWTYHLNDLQGKEPAQISLRHSDGTVYGPWEAQAENKGNNYVPDEAYWFVEPNVTIKPGQYTILDSDPETWSHNNNSENRGFAYVKGTPLQSNGYSIAIFSESMSFVALGKFNSDFFSAAEAETLTQQARLLLSSNTIDTDIVVFEDSQLGLSPDEWRSILKGLVNDFQIIFMDITKSDPRVSETSEQNIWIDIWYENLGIYVGSFGFQPSLTSLIN